MVGFDIRRDREISPVAATPLRDDYEQVILAPRLQTSLRRINDRLPEDAIEQAVRTVSRPLALAQNNRWFHHLLTDGIDVEYRMPEGESGDKVWLVDFERPAKNDLLVVNQPRVRCGNDTRRADLVVFLNGLPVVVIELKDPMDERAMCGRPTISFRVINSGFRLCSPTTSCW